MNCSMPGLPVHHYLPEFTQTHVQQVGDAIQPSHPLLSPFPPAPSSIRVFSNESTLRMRWPKYCSFSFTDIHLSSNLLKPFFTVKQRCKKRCWKQGGRPRPSFLTLFLFLGFFLPQKWGGKNCSSFLWFRIKMELLSSLVDKGPHIISFWKYIF